ncbi:MAG: MBL fold metallo-hydrolase [Halioglobus sp.]
MAFKAAKYSPMNYFTILRHFFTLTIALVQFLSISVNAAPYESYAFPRQEGLTEDNYPVPLSGKPITKTAVIVKKKGVDLKKYPEFYVPENESLAKNEMRITAIGSGSVAPIRRAQATSSYLVELGNGDSFIFDIGSGVVGNLFSMGVHPAFLDKVFITHLHMDHAGGIFSLFDAMGWARNTPLHVWGATGTTPDLGIAAFTQNVRKAAEWQVQSKQNLVPTGGTKIVPHSIDIRKFSPDNPRQLAYDKNGVKIYAFPVIHTIDGSLGYRLEWNGLSMVYTADSEPSVFEAEQARKADVFIHEVFPSAEEFAEHSKMPVHLVKNVLSAHTMPDELGLVFAIAKPTLGVASHFVLDDNFIDSAFKNLRTTYGGPVVLAQDLTTINVTPEQIVVRQAKTDLLASLLTRPKVEGVDMRPGQPSESKRPDWLTSTRITK